jgi:hypothetical protein
MREERIAMKLAQRWVKTGVNFRGNRLFLAAWEVMVPSWNLNTAAEGWEPSIDFAFLDSDMALWAMEFKKAIRSPRDAWTVLCQVTHRACELSKTYSATKLQNIHQRCYFGSDSWISASSPLHLSISHQRFLD